MPDYITRPGHTPTKTELKKAAKANWAGKKLDTETAHERMNFGYAVGGWGAIMALTLATIASSGGAAIIALTICGSVTGTCGTINRTTRRRYQTRQRNLEELLTSGNYLPLPADNKAITDLQAAITLADTIDSDLAREAQDQARNLIWHIASAQHDGATLDQIDTDTLTKAEQADLATLRENRTRSFIRSVYDSVQLVDAIKEAAAAYQAADVEERRVIAAIAARAQEEQTQRALDGHDQTLTLLDTFTTALAEHTDASQN